jgi:hypothetical protein
MRPAKNGMSRGSCRNTLSTISVVFRVPKRCLILGRASQHKIFEMVVRWVTGPMPQPRRSQAGSMANPFSVSNSIRSCSR